MGCGYSHDRAIQQHDRENIFTYEEKLGYSDLFIDQLVIEIRKRSRN